MPLKRDNIYSMIGLATRAGKTASGEFSVENAVKGGRAYLVIISGDASDNTKKKFTNMCSYYEVPIHFYGNKEELGCAMGKEQRSSMAVLDEGFANAVEQKLELKSE